MYLFSSPVLRERGGRVSMGVQFINSSRLYYAYFSVSSRDTCITAGVSHLPRSSCLSENNEKMVGILFHLSSATFLLIDIQVD